MGRRAEPLPLSNVALRVLALDGRWRPREDLVIEAAAMISVISTREACDDVGSRTPRVDLLDRGVMPPASAVPPTGPRPLRRYRVAAMEEK